jgi:type II secretion system protein N
VATEAQETAGGAIPRPLLKLGVPIAGLLLISFFVVRGFPYDQLASRIALEAERSRGIQLTIGNLGPVFRLAGPAVEGTVLRARLPGGEIFPIDRALIRPAWSVSWFSGSPAFYVEVDSPAGRATGTFEFGEFTSWVGSVQDIALEEAPLADLLPTNSFVGILDADVDLAFGERGPEGSVYLEIRDGSLSLPEFSIGLPFDRLTSELTLGGNALVAIESFEFEGPAASGSGSGDVFRAERVEDARVNIKVELTVASELAGAVRSAGLRLDREGKTKARIAGTVANPTLR